jgi:branched-subunit amino acid transport protein AzlD
MQKIKIPYKKITIGIALTITLSVIYAFSILTNLVWKSGLVGYLSISFLASLMLGIIARDYKWALALLFSSLLLGAAIATFIIIRPVMVEEPWKTDIVLSVTLSTIAKMFFVQIAINFAGTLIGILLGGKL